MATLGSGLAYYEQNLKFPGVNQFFAVRVPLLSAGTTRTYPLPALANNPAQINAINPVLPFNTPQQGRRFIPYMMCVRDVSSAVQGVAGNLAGAAATAGGTVQVIDQTNANQVICTITAPYSASPAPVLMQTFSQVTNAVQPYVQLAVVYTAPTGATATATGFTVDLFGFWQGGI